MTKKWTGPQTVCDICKVDITEYDYFVDAKTKQGPWALMCSECYKTYGIPVGQKYGPNKEKIGDLHRENQYPKRNCPDCGEVMKTHHLYESKHVQYPGYSCICGYSAGLR